MKSKGLAHARSQLSLQPGEVSAEFNLIKNENLPDLVRQQTPHNAGKVYHILFASKSYTVGTEKWLPNLVELRQVTGFCGYSFSDIFLIKKTKNT